MQAFLLLVFVTAISAVVARELWLGRLASLGGGIASAFDMASAISLIAAVFTTNHTADGAAWAPPRLSHLLPRKHGSPHGRLHASNGRCLRSSERTLHRVLAWACIPIGIGIAFGGLFGFGGELDGGIFGTVWFVAGLGLFYGWSS